MWDISSDIKTRFLIEIEKYHSIKGVSFIMDGNRRFAKVSKMNSVTSGHLAGSDTLKNVMRWCCLAGVENIGAFAFSIENFKRPQNEVDFLMDLANTQLIELSKAYEIL